MEKIIIKRGRQRRRLRSARAIHAVRGAAAAAAIALVVTAIPGLRVEGSGTASPRLPPARLDPSQPFSAVTDPAPPFSLPPAEAEALNALIPFASGPNPAARPFLLRAGAADELRSLECLTAAVYYEAASESDEGQRAVAQVVLNRVRHPAYPATVCGVVYQGPMGAGRGCQFTFTCDGALARRPSEAGWSRARRNAADALAGRVDASVGLSTHYHAAYVMPSWASRLAKVARIGAHIFYRWGGAAGTPGAFSQRHAGYEPVPMPAAARTPLLPVTAIPTTLLTTVPAAPDPLPAVRYTQDGLPQSRVREEYRNSGAWRADAPTALAGS